MQFLPKLQELLTGSGKSPSGTNTIKASLPYPKKGYQAFYLDLKYKDPNGGTFTTSTRVYVCDPAGIL